MATPFSPFNQLSDSDLVREVTRLAAREREATARLIASLAELDRRRLYLREGCASLFAYCVHVLHLAEHAAYDRIEVARAACRFPVILQHLAAGVVTLTTIRLLAPHLTAENHAALLAEARHRTRREVEQIVAGLQPRPDVPSTVRKLPTPTSPQPDAPAAEGAVRSRHIPAEVKRQVWARDGGRCAFVSPSGRRCGERGFLEFHHLVPYAKGGETVVKNLQLRCRQHNRYEAERDFGPWPKSVRETAPIFGVPPRATWFETSMARVLYHAAGPPRMEASHARDPTRAAP